MSELVIGVDFGTLSGRAVVVRVHDGAELGSAVHEYRHGVVDRALPSTGRALPPEWALQVPSDYVDVLREAIPGALAAAGVDPAHVIGVGTDFTACTMVPTTADGTPLSELPEFAGTPHAYVKLWKHHAAQGQADRINELARDRKEPWLPRYGGLISSEWEFAKGLQLLEEAPEVYAAMDRWVEAADWIVWRLTGTYVRNACSAGYKGIRQDGAYPTPEFLRELHPGFEGFVTDKLDHEIGALAKLADAVGKLGLREALERGVECRLEIGTGVRTILVNSLVAGGAGIANILARELPDDPVRGLDPMVHAFVEFGIFLKKLEGLCVLPLRGDEAAVAGQPAFAALARHRVDAIGLRLARVVLPQLHVGVGTGLVPGNLAQRRAVGEHGKGRGGGEVGGDADDLRGVDARRLDGLGHRALENLAVIVGHLERPLRWELSSRSRKDRVHDGMRIVVDGASEFGAVGGVYDERST